MSNSWISAGDAAQNGFDPSTLIGWALGALGVAVAIIIGVVMYRRQFPKRRLEWSLSSRRLIFAEPFNADVTVIVDSLPVEDPYVNTFVIRSDSRADIPSASFDGNKPTRIRMEPGGALQIGAPTSSGIEISGGHGEGFEWAEFFIEPQLIRQGSGAQLEFVTSGPPRVEVHSPLIDIDVRQVATPAEREGASVLPPKTLLLGYFLGVIVALVSAYVLGINTRP